MAVGDVDALDTAAAPPWYPMSLVGRACDPSTFADGVPSPWGRLHGWDFTVALSPEWWNTELDGRWGDWPSKVNRVEVVNETRFGLVLHVDDAWVAHVHPFPTGLDVSTLTLFEPWREALASAPILLPVAGMKRDRGDQVVVFPMHEVLSVESAAKRAREAVQSAGKVHAALVLHATPNTERRWNDRLKSMEEGLKATTLWRAPHTRHVVGLPATTPSLESMMERDGGLVVVPQPRALVDRLLAPAERRPGVWDVAMMEQRLSMMDLFAGTEARRAIYTAWGETVPSSWTSPSALSTVNGGAWIWRYEAILTMLAEARAFGLEDQLKRCDRWLLDVSRIQARLGELRTVHAARRLGVVAAAAGVIFGSGPVQLPFVIGSVVVALTAHVVHQRRTPPSF